MSLRFCSSISTWHQFGEDRFSQEDVRNEPMFHKASPGFALQNGGPITAAFLRVLNDRGVVPKVIDSRVHMLMEGWYPAIPGYHLDDVPRTRPDGQPDHAAPAYKAQHAMMVVGDSSLTTFAIGDVKGLEDVPVGGGNVYGKWHPQVEERVAQNFLFERQVRSGEVVRFSWQSFHKANPATKKGWRLFIRASWDTGREPADEFRTQANVYMTDPFAGW